MGFAKKCDRCGKLYEVYNSRNNSKEINGIILANFDEHGEYYADVKVDFCPDCKGSFDAWMAAGEK